MAGSKGKAQTVELEWDGSKYTATLTDSNNALSKFTFTASVTGMNCTVSGNKLIVTSDTAPSDVVIYLDWLESLPPHEILQHAYEYTVRQDILFAMEYMELQLEQCEALLRSKDIIITPKFIMLHTLSHLLITQLSFECGYSIASLSERLYCSEDADGKQMAGILIYTASGDSEGTLGGLVRQGRPDAFPRIFKKAVNSSKSCSNDPVCIMSHGQGRDSLNLAACHACALLPETCCEERNAFLDRGMITGTFEKRDIGFWSDLK